MSKSHKGTGWSGGTGPKSGRPRKQQASGAGPADAPYRTRREDSARSADDIAAHEAKAAEHVFHAPGEMATSCRAMDWAATTLGPVEQWPPALVTMVRTTLECPFPIALWCGPDLNLVYNDAYRFVLGAKHPKAFARPGAEVWAEIWKDLAWMFDSIRNGGPPIYAENQRFRMARTGEEQVEDAWVTFSFSAIRDDEGSVIGFLNVVSETTKRMIAEQELKEARALAEHANKAKSDFLAAMSHELRTPLNAISGYAQLIADGVRGPTTDEQREYLEKIQRSKDHLEALIRDVLSFAKVGAGRVEYNFTEVNVAAALSAVLEMVTPQITEKQLNLRPLNVPDGMCVRADEDKMRQIVINLVANALKFTPANGIIWLEVTPADDHVAISVGDTGIGIPEEKQAHIFEPFVQAKDPVGGTDHGVGLGLAISRKLAIGMNGDLAVKSSLGQGSVFTLTLPRCE